MNVQVIQGINNLKEKTVIKITTDAIPNTVLLDEVKALHNVFLEEYSVTDNTITIVSELPHFWKEAAVALNNQATAEWSYDLAIKYIFDKVMLEEIGTMSGITIMQAAIKMKMEMTQYYIEQGFAHEYDGAKFNRYYVYGAGKESEIFNGIASSQDSYLGFQTQRDKTLTNTILDRLKIPTAKWEVIPSREALQEIFDRYQKPVVMKPVGFTSGNGVVTKIDTIEKAYKAYDFAKNMIDTKATLHKYQNKIIIQEQVTGEDYRLMVIGGELMIATKRIPAFVVGDGTKTIKELVEEINKDPRRDVTKRTHTLKPIVFDEQFYAFLEEQGLSETTVPKKDEKIFVRKVASMSKGGITEDFTDKVHPQIKAVAESVATSMRSYGLGVDLMCKDISQPLTKDNGSIIECNTKPEMYLNVFPVIGKQYPEIGERILNKVLSQYGRTKKIVSIGLDLPTLQTYLTQKLSKVEGEHTGVYSDGNLYINQELLTANVPTWKAVEALKINKLLSTIVFNYTNIQEYLDNGSGFSQIDLLLVKAGTDEKLVQTLEGYRNLGYITEIVKV
jgi:D-alanine-D-alanine ligase-like ATP-grasp enzyme